MAKKITTKRILKDRPFNAESMTSAMFFGWLRSNLRRMTMRGWKPIAEVKKEARRAYKGPNKLQKWEFLCSSCGNYVKSTECEVDHIIEAGSLRSYEDLPGFVQRLFVEKDGLVLLCKQCHSSKTHNKI